MPSVTWHVRLPADLAVAIELRLLDPVTLRVDFGKKSQLTQALLYGWLEEQRRLERAATSPEQQAVDTSANPA
jgi:hypothetical protein